MYFYVRWLSRGGESWFSDVIKEKDELKNIWTCLRFWMRPDRENSPAWARKASKMVSYHECIYFIHTFFKSKFDTVWLVCIDIRQLICLLFFLKLKWNQHPLIMECIPPKFLCMFQILGHGDLLQCTHLLYMGRGVQCKARMDTLQGKQGDIVADPLKVTGSAPSLAPTHTTRQLSICNA